MIGRIQGIVVEKNFPQVIVSCHGVGYEIDVPMSTFYPLPRAGEEVTLLTHLVVREDAHLLYGFSRESQRQLFRNLLKVNGVGPRVALAVLSGLSEQELITCLAHEDIARLIKVPGIGRKTAERLILELREPLGRIASAPTSALAPRGDALQDAASALEALGYKPTEARAALRDLTADGQTSEDLIRAALKRLMRG